MVTLGTAFDTFNRKLSKFDNKTYNAKISNVIKLLTKTINPAVPITHIVSAGSNSRGVAIPGKSDVDILVVIGNRLPSGLPDKVLGSIDKAIHTQITKGGISAYVGNHAIYFPHASSSVDILLAYGKGPYYIPERDNNQWIKTDPDTLKVNLNTFNKNGRMRVKPTIRFFKSWKTTSGWDQSSFDLEMKICNIFANDDRLKNLTYSQILEIVSDQLNLKKLHSSMQIANRYSAEGQDDKAIREMKTVFGPRFG
ncbi:MAG: hypothetical protein IH840_08380 [Candidatus Heimdallarchaeota archaeon]|nr:hypothetical protein [Candidatus Heimdallarchaeota archaeon]